MLVTVSWEKVVLRRQWGVSKDLEIWCVDAKMMIGHRYSASLRIRMSSLLEPELSEYQLAFPRRGMRPGCTEVSQVLKRPPDRARINVSLEFKFSKDILDWESRKLRCLLVKMNRWNGTADS